jgi:hypothetical protein
MTIYYLLPLSLPTTWHVDDIAYLKKRGRIVRLMLTTLDLLESRGKRHDVEGKIFILATRQQPDVEVGINTCKNFQILNFRKGMIRRLMLTTLDL